MSERAPIVYPAGLVRALLDTDHVSPATRVALNDRLAFSQQPWTPSFFKHEELLLLRAVCARLIGDDELSNSVDVARFIDERLANGQSKGWRYGELPNDQRLWRDGLAGIDADAGIVFRRYFIDLTSREQDEILRRIQDGQSKASQWDQLPSALVFTEMLAVITETFYAHPLAQEEIGYVGMADLPAWNAIGLDRLDDREPRPLPRANDNT